MNSKTLTFLGGTCGNNLWRPDFIAALVARGASAEDLFNPVVPDWTPECAAKEDEVKANARYHVFYLADPKEDGNPMSSYSIHEAEMALYDRPDDTTVVIFDTDGMAGHALKAMNKIANDLRKRFPGAPIFGSLEEAVDWLAPRLVSAVASAEREPISA